MYVLRTIDLLCSELHCGTRARPAVERTVLAITVWMRYSSAALGSAGGTMSDAVAPRRSSLNEIDDSAGQQDAARPRRRSSLFDLAKHHAATDEEAKTFWIYMRAWVAMYGAITFWVGGCERIGAASPYTLTQR